MAFDKEQLESAIEQCLAGGTPASAVTRLAREMGPEDLDHLVPYLNNGPQPDGFFEYWDRKGKKTINGFFSMLDMFSALVHAQGQAGVERLVPHLDSRNPYVERVLVLATDERFSRDIVDRFLTGDPVAEPDAAQAAEPREPVPVNELMAVRQGDVEWELTGETVVVARTEREGDSSLIKVTLTNALSPIEGVRLYVRVTDGVSPPGPPSPEPGGDWTEAELIEEIVEVDDQLWQKDTAPVEDPTEEIPWTATFTARYTPPVREHQIQIMVVDPGDWSPGGEPLGSHNSAVLGDWWQSS
ncbi:hypothetical protein [Arhodomonas sp. AD133]|uniref:hypothetical protein n=1 Tax=Arhodomonas sp. AD133 TaxID=3415009 RepID=UPI003EBA41F4